MVLEVQMQDWEACGFRILVRRAQSDGRKWSGDVKSPTVSLPASRPGHLPSQSLKRSTAPFNVAPGNQAFICGLWRILIAHPSHS